MNKTKLRVLAVAAVLAIVLPLVVPVIVAGPRHPGDDTLSDTTTSSQESASVTTTPESTESVQLATTDATIIESQPQEQETTAAETTPATEATEPPTTQEPEAKPQRPTQSSSAARPTTKPAPHSSASPDEPSVRDYLSQSDIHLLATAIYLEGRGESKKCQAYIGSVILNRMIQGNKSLRSVLYAKNQFSVADDLAHTDPSGTQLDIASQLAEDGPCLPPCVTFFRANRYHDNKTVNTKYIKPYMCIDTTYFSHDIRICGNNH